MDLKTKLGRLAPVAPAGNAPRSVQGSTLGGDDRITLDVLRQRMEALLSKSPPVPRASAAAEPWSLPFLREPYAQGILTWRSEPLAGSAHVGRMPLSAAESSAAGMLALLALDPRLAGVDFRRALYLDTETTGLGGGAGTLAFLVGLARFDGNRLIAEQLLLASPSEEHAMLLYLAEQVETASCLVSFNGKAFDWPLLKGRFVMNRIPVPPEPLQLDLLHVGRRLHKHRIGSCTLKALEREVLGFERVGDIDGAEVAPRYAHFIRTGEAAALQAVVDHNWWDVLSMVALVGLYGEPLELLPREDLVGLAGTLHRARSWQQAGEAADQAVSHAADAPALEIRARIAKARGDKAQALRDFELACEASDEPRLRLELAMLYEHYVKRPLVALQFAQQGTGETAEAGAQRVARLQKKAARSTRKPG